MHPYYTSLNIVALKYWHLVIIDSFTNTFCNWLPTPGTYPDNYCIMNDFVLELRQGGPSWT